VAGLIVWIDVRRADGSAAAGHASRKIAGGGLYHLHDPRRRIGKAYAAWLGAGGALVWDVYLIFPAGERWEATPPPPLDWAHQLGAAWAPPGRYHADDDLQHWLRQAVDTVTHK
jgi:hypothetical protein